MPTRRKVLFVLIALPLVGTIAFQYWLSTGPVKKSVLSALAQVYDGHVEIEKVSLRWSGGLALRKVQLHESSGQDSALVCEIPRVDVHGSLWDLLRGQFRPTQVEIRKPTLRLVFDELTGQPRMPPFRHNSSLQSIAVVPVQISEASVELVISADTSPHKFDHVDFSITRASDQQILHLNGRATDPFGGEWRLAGKWLAGDRQLQARIRSASIELKSEHAECVPADWRELWQEFEPRGRAAVDADITCDFSGDRDLWYQVLIDPAGLSLRIPPLAERIEDLAGRVEITPKLFRAHGLIGRVGAGEVIASGTLTRDDSPSFDATAELRRLPLNFVLPKSLDGIGHSGGSVSAKIGIQGSARPETWLGQLDGTVDDIGAGGESIPLHISIADSQLRLRDLAFAWAGGNFEVRASTSLEREATVAGTVKFDEAALDKVICLAGATATDTRGTAGGEFAFQVPLRKWADSREWQWHGPVQVRHATFGDVTAQSLDGVVHLANGELVIDDARAKLNGESFRGSVRIGLETPFEISADYTMAPVELREFVGSTPEAESLLSLDGTLDAGGRLSGQLSPIELKAGGKATIRNWSVGGRRFEDTAIDYSLAGAGLEINGIDLKAFGGRVRARGRWNFAARGSATEDPRGGTTSTSGKVHPQFRLDGSAEDVDLAEVVKEFSTPQSLDGRVSGSFSIEVPRGDSPTLDSVRASGTVQSSRVAAGPTVIRNMRSDFRLAAGRLELTNLAGVHAGGAIAGSAALARADSGPVLTARLSSAKLDLEKLIGRPSGAAPLPVRGNVAGELGLVWDLSRNEVRGGGNTRITTLALESLPAIDSVTTTQFEIADQRLVLRNFEAALWGGSARGTATIDLGANPARLVEMTLDRVENVELDRVVVAWPATSSRPRGKLSGSGKLHLRANGAGFAVFGLGDFDFKSGVIAGLPIAQAEGTLEAFDAATHEIVSGRVQARRGGAPARTPDQRLWIRVRNARAARGSVQGTIQISLVPPATYDANLQFVGLDVATVARSVFASPYAAAGNLSGDLQLGGSARGPSDTRGEMRLRLQNAQLWSIPPFAVLAKLITLDPTRTGGFHSAEVSRAVISGGTVDFQEFWLAGDIIQLAGRGKVTSDGRLDLEVVSSLKSDTGRNLPIVGQIQEVIAGIQQRLIKFRVTGTIADPTVVPVPLQDVSEPAIKVLKGLTGAIFDIDGGGRPMRR